MKNNKKIIVGTTGAVSALLLGYYAYSNTTHTEQAQQKNVEQKSSGIEKVDYKSKESTTVIAEITEDGYAMVHGDHTHLEKGLIPYNAKFLESVVYKNPNHTLKDEEILYEVAQGYIVKIDGKFYYYPKKGVTQTNIVTKDKAEELSKNAKHDYHNHSNEHSSNDEKKERNSTLTTGGIAGVTRPTSDGFLLTSESQIIGRTANGIIANHNGHSHVLMYSDLAGTQWAYLIPSSRNINNVTTNIPIITNSTITNNTNNNHNDGYVFDKKDIVAEDENGYTVRHGDHYHYIPKQQLNINNASNINNINVASKPSVPHTSYIPTPNNNNKENETIENKINFSGIDFPTSDGFLFNGDNISSSNSSMFLVNHSGHLHPVLFSELVYTKWHHLIPSEHLAKAKEDYATKAKEYELKKEILANNENIKKESIKLVNTPNGHAFNYLKNGKDTTTLVTDIHNKEEIQETYPEEIQIKINKLAETLGITPNKISLVATPEGAALSYPHEDHEHTILLSAIILNDNKNEDKEDLERKIKYISEIYGVPVEAVEISETFFKFNDPSHDFDPSHIHPYVIPRNKLIIPAITGDAEIDFETELLAVADRTGISPDKIKIKNNKFAIPHGGHEHYLNIKSLDGIKPYLENKLPTIAGEYIAGELDKNIINNQIDKLIADTNKLYGENKKEARRILRELEALKMNVNNYNSNSTEGYNKVLTSFANKYIYKTEPINDDQPSELITKYNATEKLIRDTNETVFEQFGLNKNNLIDLLKENSKNINKIDYLQHLVIEINKFDRNSPYTMIYIDYFLKNIDSPKISNKLREELSSLILDVNTKFFNTREVNKLIPKIIDTKLYLALALTDDKMSSPSGEKYSLLKNDTTVISNLNDLINFSKEREGELIFPEKLNNLKNINDYIIVDNVEIKKEYIAKLLGVEKDTISVVEFDGIKAFNVPHGDHAHTIPLTDIDETKPLPDIAQDKENAIENLKKLGLTDSEIDHIINEKPIINNDSNSDQTTQNMKYSRLANNLLKTITEKANKLNNTDKDDIIPTIEGVKEAINDTEVDKQSLYENLILFDKHIDGLLANSPKENDDLTKNENVEKTENNTDNSKQEVYEILNYIRANKLHIKEDNPSLKAKLLDTFYDLENKVESNLNNYNEILQEARTLKNSVISNLKPENERTAANPNNDLGTGW